MHIVYIDDSADEILAIYSALAIPAEQWRVNFLTIKDFRRQLRDSHGIYIYKELHAWKFVSGRGNISTHILSRTKRVQIFNATLDLIAQLNGARLFNVVSPKQERLRGYEWLINRINRTLEAWDSHGIIIGDQGNEREYTRLIRRLNVYNPIPSKYQTWIDSGKRWRNLPITRILEDPFFKPSYQSFFIQLCDFAAYALLRRENPIPSKTRYGLDQSFDRLASIVVLEANPRDAYGIIRPSQKNLPMQGGS